MKIYINEFYQIKAIGVNNTGNDILTEIEVEEDFLPGYCDTVKKGFCYEESVDENGTKCVSVYPYKDFAMLESIQEQNDLREKSEKQLTSTQLALTEQYEINLALQEELSNTQLALAEIYEGLGV